MGNLALTATSVELPDAGGSYIEATSAAPVQLNPLASDPLADPGAADINALVFEGLTRSGSDGYAEPGLAESWEANDAGDVYTFTLRANLLWSDGAPLTVDDVLFTLRAVQSPGFAGDRNVAAIWREALIERVDDRRIRCALTSPSALLPIAARFPLLPAHLLRDIPPEQWSTGSFSRNPVGAGPYILQSLNAESATLAANPHYYRGRPFLDTLTLEFRNDAAILAGLTRGDVAGGALLGSAETARLMVPRGYTRTARPLDSYTILSFNMRSGLLQDGGLRRALAVGLDKDALIDSIFGEDAVRLDTPVLRGWWGSTTEPLWPAADAVRATGLLDDLGFATGADGLRSRDGTVLRLALLTDDQPERLLAARDIARQWGEIGIAIDVEVVESAELRRRLDTRRFTMALHGWQRLGPDPDHYELWHSGRAADGLNYAGLQDERIDELIETIRQVVSDDARAAATIAFQRRWVDLTPAIVLYQPMLVHYTRSDLQGLVADAAAGREEREMLRFGREGRFVTAASWYLRSTREVDGGLR